MSFTNGGTHFSLRRLSTPSYVTARGGTPLEFYTQWVWYRQERDGSYTPFYPGTLQYTLEEKYITGQHKYYFEFEDLRLMVDTQRSPMIQTNLDTLRSTKVLRRPVFVSREEVDAMSPLLLSKTPKPMHRVPAHWTTVDHFQDFELVELDSDNAEYDAVKQQFFATMDVSEHDIVRVSVYRTRGCGINTAVSGGP
ncbi:zinc finger CCCH-type antiviral protein 1-like [Pomacea canaliculata]|uniref:zinc finger CCCH-type antiviral protein 1-like n=1 Tax=Pomacea canaliculata TaxID=400727 RepID=UPI000D728302|nr:zinc finger CCCH-type antiviral protein 1-like [Pomacea canaliculata]